MSINRDKLYKFPWSKTDNAGGWVEVTDECDLSCPGCYRKKMEGHRSLEEVKKDIILCKKLTNCDGMAISGGEPLQYPHIVEVVDFIRSNEMKPVLLTNGEPLTWDLAVRLKKAGLHKILFHVDFNQGRPGWEGKNEIEMNELRQKYADLIWKLRGVQCGFHLTVVRPSLRHIPEVIKWGRRNIHKVQHLSFIAFRGLPLTDGLEYMANGRKVDLNTLPNSYPDLDKISITSDEMFEIVKNHFPDSHPCAYLGGTAAPETHKFLVMINIGSRKKIYGVVGARTIEMVQTLYHLFKGRYLASSKNPKVGKKIFALSVVDREIRKALIHFLKEAIKNPLRVFDRISLQTINFQQPREVFQGETNLCDGCLNMMIYKGELINSCRLDEYRLFGGPVEPVLDVNMRRKIEREAIHSLARNYREKL